jgi:hypothetical protein
MKPIAKQTDDEFADLVRSAAAMPDAPPAMLKAALGLWPATAVTTPAAATDAAGAALRRLGERIRALLTFDSWNTSQLALGMRSAASDTRHLLFAAEGCDVDLRITRAGPVWTVAGQVLGPDESGAVELAREPDSGTPARTVARAPLDELGEFHLAGIAEGTYVLRLSLGAGQIELPPIDVGERR